MLRRKVSGLIHIAVKAKRCKSSSISALQAAFRDPTSPFHIPPGSQGPESPDSPPLLQNLTMSSSESHPELIVDPLEQAREKLRVAGFDPKSFWEQHIVWGDHDAFQHVNNVRYARFFESSRIKWMISMGDELGGPSRGKAMMNGQGISLILKSMELRFRRPVTYPDTLLIGYRLLPPTKDQDPSTFHAAASAYSLAQNAFVTHSTDTLVWYDYDKLKKCDPGERAWQVLQGRMAQE
ncbi:hypothetical protein BYT27DRAFT_7136205 [Phlegmacium glaucopus]|nr:hypothetical protein BYT27DRAFT_7136205 [Phlegmacium glaucopus]